MIAQIVFLDRQGKFSTLSSFCFAEYLRYYYIVSNDENKENNYHPEEFTNELVEFKRCVNSMCPKVTPLTTSNERLKCRKILFALQFHVPNRQIS